MKIVLKASRELDRQIAKMCGICWNCVESHESKLIEYDSEGQAMGYTQNVSITLDLSKVELDLRMAIGTPIKFNYGRLVGVNFESELISEPIGVMANEKLRALKDLKLSADWLRESGIEIVEDVWLTM